MHGQFCWYDLMTPDPAGAKRFYTSLLGWKVETFKFASPDQPYDMWAVGGKTFGGVSKLGEQQKAMGIPPHWLPAVEVNNVDETASKAMSLGGRVIVAAMDIPDTGRYAVLTDPQGAAIAIFQANGPFAGFDGTVEMGKPSWHELMTTDFRRAFEFYRALFGWDKIDEVDMGPGGVYFEYGMKGKMFGGMYNRPAEMGAMPPFWLPYFHVKDIEASTAAAKKAGAVVQNGPMEVPGGDWIVVMGDPQGAAFAMHARKATPREAVERAVKKTVKQAVKKTVKKAKKVVKQARSAMKKKPKAKARPKSRPRAKAKKSAKKKSRKR